ncbi:hypothetical protein AK812_SmicGene18174 [Symbiodinium microadriaticum]|uniref:Uncharacterized protein n=1 Tax=Symbiodinium microadriaticum TaxID=2951 RepID=A0A1Q9DVR6_SYMMI|nr:hypothetical protein AK812_SmicGene18174 [Symbiodinium microadriaticum]
MEWGKLAAKSITVSTANVQQQEHSHLHLVSAVAMAKLQFLAALACAAVAEACNKNSDCASNWCDGGTFFSSGRCKPRRADGERAVGSWPSYDYNICLAGRGKCGICGDRVPDGSACTANSDCVSDWCEGFGSCSGVCKGRKADGTRIVCDSLSITTGGCDYNQCEARAGKCGVCGRTVPDGSTCSENADCSSGWCEGFPSVGCQGSCRPKKDDGYRLPCNDPTKVTSGGCDYNQCKASEGRCGVCGRKVPTGTSCSQESDCASNVCRLPAGVLGTSLGCNGQCAEPLPDGSMLPRLTWPINGAFYDYSECSAGAGICGVCGSRAGEGAKCSATADCAEDLCCGGVLGGRISVNCQGTCVKRTPSACPSLVDMSALTEVVDSFVKFARDFGQCMIEEVVEPWLEDEYGCRFSASPQKMTASLTCTQLDPERARRLAARDETGSWARRFGYADARAARLYRLGPEPFGELGLGPGRQLLGIGSAEEPSTSQLGCRETQYCNAGAILSVVASLDFKPKVTIDIDTRASTATISLEGDVTGTAGVGALAGGSCSYERELFFPSAPKPVATYCLYAVCVTVLIQGSVKLAVEGELQATASAEYHTVYRVGGQATLELSSENLDQSANAAITADRVSDHWSLNAVGSMSASISVTVGPVVTILVVPGTFATLHPFVMAQASLFGTMKFEKASASEAPEGITAVSWPVSSEVCTDEAQKQSLANRQFTQQRPGKETTSSGNATSGQGFTLAADLLDTASLWAGMPWWASGPQFWDLLQACRT